MRKINFFGEYTAPELEVISTVVEQGFTLSNGEGSTFSLTGEDDDINF